MKPQADPTVYCEGKVSFDSFSLADAVVQRRKRAKSEQRKSRTAYRCTKCGKWHIGSDPIRMHKVKERKRMPTIKQLVPAGRR